MESENATATLFGGTVLLNQPTFQNFVNSPRGPVADDVDIPADAVLWTLNPGATPTIPGSGIQKRNRDAIVYA